MNDREFHDEDQNMTAPDADAIARLKKAEAVILAEGSASDVPPELIAEALYVAARLFSARTDKLGKTKWHVGEDALNATDTVVLVTALLEAADVNLFDMAILVPEARMNDSVLPAPRDVRVTALDDLVEKERIVVDIDGKEVGLYHLDGEIRCWENICPHQGGLVCQGKIMPRTVQLVRENRKSGGLGFSESERNIVCPWHGFEFDILTGRHPSHHALQLRSVPVRVVDGQIIVTI
jgi:nitrite reductase/ring-hydroxylating ferredoxin subunit